MLEEDTLVYDFWPAADEELKFRWSLDGVELVISDLKMVGGLEAIKAKDADLLKATFGQSGEPQPSLIKFKPSVWVSWGTDID